MRFGRPADSREVRDELIEQISDAELVRAAQIDVREFEHLYRRYRDPIMNYCFYRLGDQTEADDAASTIFLDAIRALPALKIQDGSFRRWLFTIARNEVTDRWRQTAHHPKVSITAVETLSSPDISPEAQAVSSDGRRYVLTLLRSLPSREREVLELRAGELTTSEIAQFLGINEQAVRTAQCRAIARMKGLVRTKDASGQEVSRV